MMKTRIRVFSILFALLGILCSAAAIGFVLRSLNMPPHILQEPDSAVECSETLMECIRQGDYTLVSEQLLGNPILELDRTPEDPVGVLLWEAYQDSLSYTFGGTCYATDSGLAREVTVEAMDLPSVMNAIGPLATEYFQTKLDSAEDSSVMYDSDGNYREEFIREALMHAAQTALAENNKMTKTTLTLQLSYQNGRWFVVADQALLRIIGGGITG